MSATFQLNIHKIFFNIKQNTWTFSLLHYKPPNRSSINAKVVSEGPFKQARKTLFEQKGNSQHRLSGLYHLIVHLMLTLALNKKQIMD